MLTGGSGQTSFLKYSGIFMGIIFYVLLTLFLVLLAFVIWTVVRTRQQAWEELSFSFKCYKGPAGEPLWNGILPTSVDDYTEPRYVYENLKESCDYLPENGRIIGYRISPELVIHSRINPSLNLPCLSSYISRYGGKLLNLNECVVLLDNWDKVSQLREKAGDAPLDVKTFWALSDQSLPIEVNVYRRTCRNMVGFNNVWCALILKR